MATLALVLTVLVALEHFYILYLEIFAIDSAAAKRTFGLTDEFLKEPKVKVLFANQGLYNGFLASGILFGLFLEQNSVIYFFLSCVIIAAIYGAFSANRSIFIKQGLPAILALICQIAA